MWRNRFGVMLAIMAVVVACDSGEASRDAAPADTGWGPSFFGVASDIDDSGAAADVGLGVLWDPERIEMPFADATCFVVHTLKADVVGKDPGEVIVRGGSGTAEQPLTRNDQGYYYLDGEADPWHEGDSVSVEADGQTYGTHRSRARLRRTTWHHSWPSRAAKTWSSKRAARTASCSA